MPFRLYRRTMFQQHGYLVNWLPNSPLQVGDIGILAESGFARVSSLEELGVNFEIQRSRKAKFEVADRVSIAAGVEASGFEVGLAISFGRRGGSSSRQAKLKLTRFGNLMEFQPRCWSCSLIKYGRRIGWWWIRP